jgi:hypothetical protein
MGGSRITGRRRIGLPDHPLFLTFKSRTPGEWVLIHVGFAMSKISEADAAEQMRLLTTLGEQQAAMEELQGYGGGSEQ